MRQQNRDSLLDTTGKIVGFYEREYYVFSNFSSFWVEWRGEVWPTSEYAYQAAHFFDTAPELADAIRQCRSSHDAYKLAKSRANKAPADWDEVKEGIMLDICRHKLLQHPYAQQKLRETGDLYMVEDSPKDSFWGWGPDRNGRNALGKIWMQLRQELLAGSLPLTEPA